ncbi:Ribosome biogenesis protein BRX1 [Tetrabaena socialis]|uniref:Ribosome biogenesis protein BRX1 n=1 Tax=Tetrabaena socialis TaxID=47790 RepID=A0A2J8ADT5_9CHLO|nr:Ribosome biogenesis protein BRX1 [Tetrabaena socialis]|eukprot:PNH10674.1 Ribosome biogenesis protein BRX1 [Tetrabaena socialis]
MAKRKQPEEPKARAAGGDTRPKKIAKKMSKNQAAKAAAAAAAATAAAAAAAVPAKPAPSRAAFSTALAGPAPAAAEAVAGSGSTAAAAGVFKNKEKVLVLSTRGVTFRYRHLMEDVLCLLPHAKKESKLDTKSDRRVINEVADLKNCTSTLFFEFVPEPIEQWQNVGAASSSSSSSSPSSSSSDPSSSAAAPAPTVNLLELFYRDQIRMAYTFQNYVFLTRVMQERETYGSTTRARILERSVFSDRMVFVRAALAGGSLAPHELAIYDAWFGPILSSLPTLVPNGLIYLRASPQTCMARLVKRARSEENSIPLSYLQTFATPKRHHKAKPFFDHVLSFTLADDRVWVRNYQLVVPLDKKRVDPDNSSLVEVGPRFCLNPIKIFSGSFGGPTIYDNPSYTSPNAVRSALKRKAAGKYDGKVVQRDRRTEHKANNPLPRDPMHARALPLLRPAQTLAALRSRQSHAHASLGKGKAGSQQTIATRPRKQGKDKDAVPLPTSEDDILLVPGAHLYVEQLEKHDIYDLPDFRRAYEREKPNFRRFLQENVEVRDERHVNAMELYFRHVDSVAASAVAAAAAVAAGNTAAVASSGGAAPAAALAVPAVVGMTCEQCLHDNHEDWLQGGVTTLAATLRQQLLERQRDALEAGAADLRTQAEASTSGAAPAHPPPHHQQQRTQGPAGRAAPRQQPVHEAPPPALALVEVPESIASCLYIVDATKVSSVSSASYLHHIPALVLDCEGDVDVEGDEAHGEAVSTLADQLYEQNLEADLAPWRDGPRRNTSALMRWAAAVSDATKRMLLIKGDLRRWVSEGGWPEVAFFLNVADISICRKPKGRPGNMCPVPVLSVIKQWHQDSQDEDILPLKYDTTCSRTFYAQMSQSSAEWQQYIDVGLVGRYVLALDGYTASGRLSSLLALNSVVLKQASTWIEWYYRSLVPGIHYIGFWKTGRSDLLHVLHSMRQQDDYLQEVSANGQAFASRHLVPDARRLYWLRTLTEYGKLFSDMDTFVAAQIRDFTAFVSAYRAACHRLAAAGHPTAAAMRLPAPAADYYETDAASGKVSYRRRSMQLLASAIALTSLLCLGRCVGAAPLRGLALLRSTYPNHSWDTPVEPADELRIVERVRPRASVVEASGPRDAQRARGPRLHSPKRRSMQLLVFAITLASLLCLVRCADADVGAGGAPLLGLDLLRRTYPNHSWATPVEPADEPRMAESARPRAPVVEAEQLYKQNLEADLAPWRGGPRRNTSAMMSWAAAVSDATKRVLLVKGGKVAVLQLRGPAGQAPTWKAEGCDRPCNQVLADLLADLRRWVSEGGWPEVAFFLNVADISICRKPKGRPGNMCPVPVLSVIKQWHQDSQDEDILVPAVIPQRSRQRPLYYFPWRDKIERAAFRGSPYCHRRPLKYDTTCSRTFYAQMSQSSAEWQQYIDVGLVRGYTKHGPGGGTLATIVPKGHMATHELARFKYVLALDGYTASRRLSSLLALNSVVLKQASTWVEWYYRSLVPGIHYIGFWKTNRSDLLDLLHVLHSMRQQDDYLQEVAANGQAFASRHLVPDARRLYWLRTLTEYGKLFSDMDTFVAAQELSA